MPTITVETLINAPIDRVFDAARDIGLHCQTLADTQERAVAGVTTGLIGLHDSVTFEGVHFGVRQRLSATVTQFDRPHCFVDDMTRGAFASLRHTHEFFAQNDASSTSSTLMRDTLTWKAPLGPLGLLADGWFLKRYMHNLITDRGQRLKQWLETPSATDL